MSRSKASPRDLADRARERIAAAPTSEAKLEIWDSLPAEVQRVYQARSRRDARVAGRYLNTRVSPEAWAPFKARFDTVCGAIEAAGRERLPTRATVALRAALLELNRLAHDVKVLVATPEANDDLRAIVQREGNRGGAPTGVLARILVAAFADWSWSGEIAALRERLDRRVAEPWDLPPEVTATEVTAPHFVAKIRGVKKPRTWPWASVARAARKIPRG